jgi:hypothetical protein
MTLSKILNLQTIPSDEKDKNNIKEFKFTLSKLM